MKQKGLNNIWNEQDDSEGSEESKRRLDMYSVREDRN